MKGTVAIIGANQTGLFAAKLFSEQGFSVFVFEKNSRENAAYEWTDDISPSVFKEVGLPFPPNESRRGLNDWLISLLSEGVELYFDACVTRALTDGDVVYGVEFSNGETFECDLVVDCGGVNSSVRRSLPQIFQIQNEVNANDNFSRVPKTVRSQSIPKKFILNTKTKTAFPGAF